MSPAIKASRQTGAEKKQAQLKKVMHHPLRVKIMQQMQQPRPETFEEYAALLNIEELTPKGRANLEKKFKAAKRVQNGWSPVEMHHILGTTLGALAFHFRKLNQLGLIELVKELRVRGAVEHYYGSTKLGDGTVRSHNATIGTFTVEYFDDADKVDDDELVAMDVSDIHSLLVLPGQSIVLQLATPGRSKPRYLRLTR